MSFPPLASDFMSIVVRGQFDPAKFVPRQLYLSGIIGESEYRNAEISVLLPAQMTQFKTKIFSFDIQTDVFQLSTTDEREFEGLRDIAVGMLRELRETPIRVLGINRNADISVPDVDRFHRIGDTLLPKAPWGDALKIPGMRGLLVGGVRPDGYAGRVDVRVEQSSTVRPGILVAYNDHYDLVAVDKQPETRDDLFEVVEGAAEATIEKVAVAIEILLNEWGPSLARSASILERVEEWGR